MKKTIYQRQSLSVCQPDSSPAGFKKKLNPYVLTGGILLAALILLALLVPALSPYSYETQNVEIQNAGSSLQHLFGTDKFGRDLFVRVWYGTRISLLVGAGSALFCGVIGIFYGSIAGYAGQKTDMLMMRLADIIDAIPSLLYVILIMLVLGANVGSILLGICISGWIDLARIVRGGILCCCQDGGSGHCKSSEEAFAAECGRAGNREYHLSDTEGDIYGGVPQLCGRGHSRTGGEPGHIDTGCQEPDAGLSVPDVLSDCGAVYFDIFCKFDRGRA